MFQNQSTINDVKFQNQRKDDIYNWTTAPFSSISKAANSEESKEKYYLEVSKINDNDNVKKMIEKQPQTTYQSFHLKFKIKLLTEKGQLHLPHLFQQ